LTAARPDARLLALRPVGAAQHLPRGSPACPVSSRGWLRASERRGPLPIFRVAYPALFEAALVAAREADAFVALALPPQLEPERWFAAVAAAAAELAPGLPIVLAGEVRIGPGPAGAERAVRDAHRLVEAGLTHLCIDVAGLPVAERARMAAAAAGFAAERELGIECLLPTPAGETPAADDAHAFAEELRGWGLEPDALSVRGAPASTPAAAAAQAQALAAVAAALAPLALIRRGPLSEALLLAAASAGLAALEDGDRLGAAVGRTLADDARIALEGTFSRGTGSGAAVAPGGERLAALAFAEAAAVLERLGAVDSAAAAAAALLRAC